MLDAELREICSLPLPYRGNGLSWHEVPRRLRGEAARIIVA
jgi:hypothetical protein